MFLCPDIVNLYQCILNVNLLINDFDINKSINNKQLMTYVSQIKLTNRSQWWKDLLNKCVFKLQIDDFKFIVNL